MLSINEKPDLYSKVANKSYSSSRDFLAYAYGKPKVHYYNADTKEEKETKNKGKLRYFALIAASLGAISAIAAPLIRSKKIDIEPIIKNSQRTITKAKNSEFVSKLGNIASNINNIKDELWKNLTKKLADIKIKDFHPFSIFDTIGKKSTDLYNKITLNSELTIWNNNRNKLLEMAKQEGLNLEIDEFSCWFENLKNSIDKALHKDGSVVLGTLKNKSPKEIFEILSKENIADKNIMDIVHRSMGEIAIPEGASENLIQEINKFNQYKSKIGLEFSSKLRDLCSGSATTDLLTQGITLASLGGAIAAADTKEEKQSISINVGIPLVTTMLTTSIALVKRISGAPAIAFGLILGKIGSTAAKTINNLNKKRYEN